MAREEWQRVAKAVKARRAELDLTQEELAAAGGDSLSSATIRIIERAGQDTYRPSTLRSLCRALAWTPQSIDDLRNGKAATATKPAARAPTGDLERRVDDLTKRFDDLETIVRDLASREVWRRWTSPPDESELTTQ